ncbi:probable cytochrome P450 CYP44 isoform X2 [Portunus trituberculatus]|uniref:probable cytochrome P450 CYP44 isoform X2 n=1 Tax=Portunus trituberculatus TaxID=210409 RepID=UPI001E1CBB0D|nr:probable cytochrome P450 CYP44 isoform X2 [Portunus trituberculatus]
MRMLKLHAQTLLKRHDTFLIAGKRGREVVRHLSNVSADVLVEESAKPFTAIPGPPRLPVLGTLLPYKVGLKKLSEYHHEVCRLHQQYGPVVREVFGSQTLVHVFDPADIKTVYDNDGKMPHVPPLQETSQFYRKKKSISPGLGNINGEEWYRLRHAVQQMMLRPRETSYYYPIQDEVACRAVDKLEAELDDQGFVRNLDFLIPKWIMESAGMCCFEKSIGCLNGGAGEDWSQRLVETNLKIFQLSAEMKFSLRLYRFFKSPKYRSLLSLEDYFYGSTFKFINDVVEELKALVAQNKLQEGQYNFLTYLLSRKELSHKDVLAITFSLFTDGLSTTAPTFLGNLHCLALNQDVQETLYQEINKTHIDPDAPITLGVINKMRYLKAVVKEVFRFYPVGEAVQRFSQRDMVLGGYHIPAWTYLELNPYVWLQSKEHFVEPEKFMPERWLRDTAGTSTINPYVLNPFSMGIRMCAGRRFAEQDIYIGLCRLLLKFRVEATSNDPPEQEWAVLLKPKTPLPVKFVKRE